MTAQPALHIVFGVSAAGSVRQAFRIAARDEEVLCPFDDFSFGPILPDDADTRSRWVEEILGYSGWQDIVDSNAQFLEEGLSTHLAPIAWVSFREARSYAGFLWWLSHMGRRSCSIVNIPNLSLCSAEKIIESFDCEVRLGADERRRRQVQWRILQSENAPLRIIAGDDLVSAPLAHFDSFLLDLATTEWQPMGRLVGEALASFYETGLYQAGDLFLASRVAELAEAGKMKWRGDLSQMQGCELRSV